MRFGHDGGVRSKKRDVGAASRLGGDTTTLPRDELIERLRTEAQGRVARAA